MLLFVYFLCLFFFSSRRRHTRLVSDWSSDVCSSDLHNADLLALPAVGRDQLVDQRALAGAGIAGDPDHSRVPLGTVQSLQRGLADRLLALQQRDQAGDRPDLTGLDAIR